MTKIQQDGQREFNILSSRKKCLLCGEFLSDKKIAEFKNMPASAQNIPDFNELTSDKGIDLNLFQCQSCGLVQFDCEPVDYYKDVIRSGGYSTTMVELRRSQYKHLIEKYSLQGKKFIEVGCGQGEFLSVLTEFPVEAYGIENTKRLVDIAKEKGLNVSQDFLGSPDKKLDGAPFDVFLSFNFLEHQPEPNEMIRGIYNNLNDDGMGLITVPSFEYIIDKNCYYEFIRDHLAYYTFETLTFAFEKNGFEVLEKEMVNRDTLAIIVKKKPRYDLSSIIENQKQLYKDINRYIDSHKEKGHRVAIWGASHQGFTIASTVDLTNKIDVIIDSAPFKQGRFSPASHIKIVSPTEAQTMQLDAIIIIAPGYTDEIAGDIRRRFSKDIEISAIRTDVLEIMDI